MAINTLATAALFQKTLDEAAVREATTGWMEANAGQVIYNGGAEVKIPKMTLQGMANYDRDKGYTQGSITLEYETRRMTQDRGRKFTLDAMDTNETNFVVNAAGAMSQFQKKYVIPEIDAYRISKLASDAITANKVGMIKYGYTPGATGTSALREIKEAIAAVKEHYTGPLICQATSTYILELELELPGKFTTVIFNQGGVDLRLNSIDDVPIISTPSDRMYTSIQINDGKTVGQEAGGYKKGATGKDINFFVCPVETPIGISKQDLMRIFDPNTYQDANAWSMDYRRFHDLWVKDNMLGSIALNIKDAKE